MRVSREAAKARRGVAGADSAPANFRHPGLDPGSSFYFGRKTAGRRLGGRGDGRLRQSPRPLRLCANENLFRAEARRSAETAAHFLRAFAPSREPMLALRAGGATA
jgi:hypothetical protein